MMALTAKRRTSSGDTMEDVTIVKTTMVTEEAVVAVVEEATFTTITTPIITTITTMIEEVAAMVEAVEAKDIMGTATSTKQTSNTVMLTSSSQCSNWHLNLTRSQGDNSISHSIWTAILVTNIDRATVPNGVTNNGRD